MSSIELNSFNSEDLEKQLRRKDSCDRKLLYWSEPYRNSPWYHYGLTSLVVAIVVFFLTIFDPFAEVNNDPEPDTIDPQILEYVSATAENWKSSMLSPLETHGERPLMEWFCEKLALQDTFLTPDMVTYIHPLFAGMAGYLVSTKNDPFSLLLAAVFLEIRQLLDVLDGVLARAKNSNLMLEYAKKGKTLGQKLDCAFDVLATQLFLYGGFRHFEKFTPPVDPRLSPYASVLAISFSAGAQVGIRSLLADTYTHRFIQLFADPTSTMVQDAQLMEKQNSYFTSFVQLLWAFSNGCIAVTFGIVALSFGRNAYWNWYKWYGTVGWIALLAVIILTEFYSWFYVGMTSNLWDQTATDAFGPSLSPSQSL